MYMVYTCIHTDLKMTSYTTQGKPKTISAPFLASNQTDIDRGMVIIPVTYDI